MHHRYSVMLITTALAAAIGIAYAHSGDGNSNRLFKHKMFGKGHPFVLEDLPHSRFRERLKRLPLRARVRARRWLQERFAFPEQDVELLEVDDQGAILYVDPAPTDLPAEPAPSPTADASSPLPSASAVDDAFFLHSRPGAPNTVYLDFDGHIFSNTAWSSGTVRAKAFDLDGSPSSFNSTERAAIAEIWHRVAEDFAPFNIDVTTQEPATFGPYTGRVLITSRTQTNGSPMPYSSGGGVAYVGVWGHSNYDTYYSPALVYFDNLASGTTYIAEASSHEFGHNLGLSHHGTSSTAYYAGHGSGYTSWAPIMGNSYYKNVTQWSNGEYAGANNPQDDLAVITEALSRFDDDHGDTLGTATPLVVDSNGAVVATNPALDPHNSYPENKGTIHTSSDRDLFSFTVPAGSLDFTVNPGWDAFYRSSKRGANLDIEARLLDANGATLATSDPIDDTYASLSANVSAGTYYLELTGVGNGNYSDYASAGQYFVLGTVPSGAVPNAEPTAGFGFGCMDLTCSFHDASIDSDGTITARSWAFGDGNSSNAENPSHTYAAAGTYNVTLTVTDNAGAIDTATQSLTVSEPETNTPPSANFTFNCTDLGCSFADSSDDSDGTITTWSWNFGDGESSTAQNPSHTYAAAGTYSVTLTVTDDDGASESTKRDASVTEPVVNTPPSAYFTFNCTDLGCSFADSSDDSDGTIAAWSWDFGDGESSTAQNPNHNYAAAGSYSVTLTVTDDAGATDNASASVTVTAPPPSGWTELTFDDFETGWGNWRDGGSDAMRSTRYSIGNYSLNLQDNSSTSESRLASSLDLRSYSALKIEFSYVVRSFEKSEDFWVRYSADGGSSWQTVKAFVNDVDFLDNGTRYNPVITIDSGNYAFTDNVLIKLECDASGNRDDVYIDNVRISAQQ